MELYIDLLLGLDRPEHSILNISQTNILKRDAIRVPAVDHDGPRKGRIERLDFLEELEHADGREGHAEVGPAGEVELRDQTQHLAGVAGLLRAEGNKVLAWRA